MADDSDELVQKLSGNRDDVFRSLLTIVARDDPVLLEKAIPGMLALLGHKDMYVRMNAEKIIPRINQEFLFYTVVPELNKLLESENSFVRMNAAEAICLIGDKYGRRKVAASEGRLVKLLEDAIPQVRKAAAKALGVAGGRIAIVYLTVLEAKEASEEAQADVQVRLACKEAGKAIKEIEKRLAEKEAATPIKETEKCEQPMSTVSLREKMQVLRIQLRAQAGKTGEAKADAVNGKGKADAAKT